MLPLKFYRPHIAASGSDVIYTPEGIELQSVESKGDFNFTIAADGGYWDLAADFGATESDAEEWLEDGLGRHVVAYNPALDAIWEGVVNQVSIGYGGLSVSRGPLTDVINRCSVEYGLQEVVGSEIVTTQGYETTIADHTASKLKYGVFEKVLSAGTVWSNTEAAEIRDTVLAESAYPPRSEQLAIGSGGNGNVQVSCIGYIHFLGNYIYEEVGSVTSEPIYDPTDAGSKLRVVLEADPNNLFTDDSLWTFDTNVVLESPWEDEKSDAWTLIKSMVSKGDGSNNRMLFGCYAGRKLVYRAIPTGYQYEHRVKSTSGRVSMYPAGGEIDPWDVLPGNWLVLSDFLTSSLYTTPGLYDPRAMFIERVAFSTPYGLQLDGVKVSKLAQKLARLGAGV